MKRSDAIQNGMLVMNYLSQFHPRASLTLEFETYQVRLHYVDYHGVYSEVKNVAEKLVKLRIAGSELNYHYNNMIDQLTFYVIWDITD